MSQSRDAQVASSEFADGNPLDDLEVNVGEGDELSVDDLIRVYLDHNPEPSDVQIHHLASLVGLPFEEFEQSIYRMFGDVVGDESDDQDTEEPDDIADGLLDEGDDADVDSLDMFLISFFLRNSSPTDEQIHILAELVGLTPADLEERIYSLLADFVSDDDFADSSEFGDDDEPT